MDVDYIPCLLSANTKSRSANRSERRKRQRSTMTMLAMRRALSERISESCAASWRAVRSVDLRCEHRCTARVASARQAAIYFAHVVFAASFTRAGGIFGRDRTTARHACSRMEDWRDDGRIDRAFDALEPALRTWVEAFAPQAGPETDAGDDQ
jgi:chromosomal replication initiation ATPase DnaA